ncbi:sensor histidine kinase [Balneatrix alpica]|uniref:histidine kinase n=1 Tax=Balneatrix alpica TaxID=75684 RepID=A0ABV5ZFX0_9GAMM|nr:HAMP domain-containing sensor histidine kinase [Balneatrix alpica]
MRRLYWKILLAVLGTMLLVGLTSFWLARQLSELNWDERQMRTRWQSEGAYLVERWQEEGPEEGAEFLRHIGKREGLFLVGPDFRLLTPAPIPPGVARSLERNLRQHGERARLRDDWRVVRLDSFNPPYWLVVNTERQQLRQHKALFPLHVLVSITLVALICLLLTAYLTRPLRALSQAARGLAAGQLTTRVSPGLCKRRDELGQLAQDFNQMAERIQQLLEDQQQLLRDVSHELRTPLARLQIALELARHRTQGQADKELDRIEQEGDSLNELIDEVLTLVRAGQPQDEPETIDLAQLCRQRLELAQLEAEQAGVTLCSDLSEGLRLTGQSRWLGRALDNLIRNALQYSPAGTQVGIRLQPLQQGAELEVWDQGPGVEPQALEHLFKPFFRADQARTSGKGYGIGLAIVERVLRHHGAQVQVVNRAEGGLSIRATFTQLN